MKRLPEILTFCFITLWLLTSGKPEMKSAGLSENDFLPVSEHDTTGLTGFLKTQPFNLTIIPPSSGIQFFKDGIVFLSNTKFEGKMLAKHVSFGSIEAYTAIIKDTTLGFHVLFSPSSSFSFPCEAITFTPDYKTMYYTKIGKKEKKEKIYRAEYKQDEKGEPGWVTDDIPLDFCTGNYIYTHPALSSDGKILIFASDMSGSLGGMDLFVARKTGEKWSKPENMGKGVNTVRFECFPFLDNDNNLYYSSDGLAGYGGYDIFSCKFNGESWEKPVNLSKKINSEIDDIAFSISRTDGKTAFYTTRPKSGSGDMHLIRVSLKQASYNNDPLSIAYIFNGRAVTKTELIAVKAPEKEPEKPAPAEVKKEVKTEEKKAPAQTAEAKVVIIQNTSALPAELKDKVVYRIQFLSTSKARKETQIVISGKTYKTYEYFYLNLYRYTVGEFTTLPPAKELQAIVRSGGYDGAFVAAFKNNTRSLDLTLFK